MTRLKPLIMMLTLCLCAGTAMAADRSAPQAPRLISPNDGAVLRNFPRRVTFQWRDVSDRSGVVYYIQIDTNYPNGQGGGEWRRQVFGPLRDNTYIYTHVGDQQGMWSVWAVDGSGNEGERSETRSFTFYTAVPEDQAISAQPRSAMERVATPAPRRTPLPATPAPSVAMKPPDLTAPAPVNTNYWSQPLPQLASASTLAEELKGASVVSHPTDGGSPAVSLVSPGSGARLSNYPREVTLKWSEAKASGVAYTVEVQTIYPFEGGGSAARSQFYRNVSGTSVVHRHPGDYEGRWRVWYVDSNGTASAASDWRPFVYETDGVSQKKEELTAVAGAIESLPQASIPSPLTQEVASVAPKLQASLTAVPVVTPRVDGGDTGGASSIPAPMLDSPRDGAIIDDDEDYVICKWLPVEGARYVLEKQTYDAATGQWNSEFFRNLTTTKKTANHKAPLPGRWRVMATMNSIEGPWSPWRSFSYHGEGAQTDAPEATSRPQPFAQIPPDVDQLAPDAPVLIAPANSSAVTSADRRVELTWSGVQDPSGVSYTCVVETPGAGGQWQTARFPGLQEPKMSYQNPQAGSARWWVIAIDGAGNASQPSKVHEIAFQPDAGAAFAGGAGVQPLAPTTGSAVAPGNVDLSWSAGSGAARVDVQVLENRSVGGGKWTTAVSQDVQGQSLTVQIQPDYQVRWRVSSGGTATAWQYFRTGK